MLANKFGISEPTVSKWKNRENFEDKSSRPHTIHYALNDIEKIGGCSPTPTQVPISGCSTSTLNAPLAQVAEHGSLKAFVAGSSPAWGANLQNNNSVPFTQVPDTTLRLYAIVRLDLGMDTGKIASQAGHAYLGAFINAEPSLQKE